jgi:hypothetical protein
MVWAFRPDKPVNVILVLTGRRLIYLSITVFRYSYTIDQVIYSMKYFKLKNDLIVSNWFLSIDASANIQRNYFQAIKALCEFTVKRLMDIFWKLKRKLNLV